MELFLCLINQVHRMHHAVGGMIKFSLIKILYSIILYNLWTIRLSIAHSLYAASLPLYFFHGEDVYYTGCTLKLRAVKLLFVIFGRLSYTFFGKNLVLRNGRLSYII